MAWSGQDGSDERVEEMEQQVRQQQDQILELQRTKLELERKHAGYVEQMRNQEQQGLLDDYSKLGGFGTSDDDERCLIRK